ncbi:MAG: hypothetical protein AVDCRST_MAG26-1581, partial [uncultured Chloroflexia bacterium]
GSCPAFRMRDQGLCWLPLLSKGH